MIIVHQGIYLRPKRLWLLYMPGLVCLLAGLLILIAPKTFAVVLASLLIAGALVLLYATRKFCLFVNQLEHTSDESETDLHDAIHRFAEHRIVEGQWVN